MFLTEAHLPINQASLTLQLRLSWNASKPQLEIAINMVLLYIQNGNDINLEFWRENYLFVIVQFFVFWCLVMNGKRQKGGNVLHINGAFVQI